jgi:phosphatidylglycerol:prolipoprotein diacylglycerol transferase
VGDIFDIPMYNLMIGIGLIAGFILLDFRIKQYKIDHKTDDRLHISLVFSILMGFFGAKVFEMIYEHQPFSMTGFINSGITFYGGLIFGIITFLGLCLVFKLNCLSTFNLVTPSLILAHAFGRMGCFLGGCCFGIPTTSPIGVTFPENSLPFIHYGHDVKILPVQLFEAFLLLGLFIVIIRFIQINIITPVYFISYGVIRFSLEFFRGDFRGEIFNNALSPSQSISIVLILTGVIILLVSHKIFFYHSFRQVSKRQRKGD